MLALGTKAPNFALTNTVDGTTVSRDDFAAAKGLLVMFICNHCPYVKHVRAGLVALGNDYADGDVAIVAISSNDPESYPADGPEAMAAEAAEFGYRFPYLFDEHQSIAKEYTAQCTPDFFLFDADRTLVYRGQFDSSRPNTDIPVTGADVRAAIDALVADEPIPEPQRPSIGCSIKWRPGNEPA
jgi:peroxiredoxin